MAPLSGSNPHLTSSRDPSSHSPSAKPESARRAFITGITGQDGSYLAELLLGKGYEVHGLVRRSSAPNTQRIDHLRQDPNSPGCRLFLHHGDMTDGTGVYRLIQQLEPHEIYNLAAQSHVRVSFETPLYTVDVVAHGTLRMLEAARELSRTREVRFYQASSSEMFGQAAETPQTEKTPFRPRSPYACAKVYAHLQTVNYREAYGLYACSGILFNHESPRRGTTFVTRKITRAAARIAAGLQTELHLGNLDTRRDWGYAPEYVEAMWLMLQQAAPADFVIATNETHTVREFLDLAFHQVGLNPDSHLVIDPRFLRPAEVDILQGDYSRAKEQLGWSPQIRFPDLVRLMVAADQDLLQRSIDTGSDDD